MHWGVLVLCVKICNFTFVNFVVLQLLLLFDRNYTCWYVEHFILLCFKDTCSADVWPLDCFKTLLANSVNVHWLNWDHYESHLAFQMLWLTGHNICLCRSSLKVATLAYMWQRVVAAWCLWRCNNKSSNNLYLSTLLVLRAVCCTPTQSPDTELQHKEKHDLLKHVFPVSPSYLGETAKCCFK